MDMSMFVCIPMCEIASNICSPHCLIKKVLLPTPSISFLVVCLPPAGKYSCDDSVKPQLFGHRAHRVHLKNKVYKEL